MLRASKRALTVEYLVNKDIMTASSLTMTIVNVMMTIV